MTPFPIRRAPARRVMSPFLFATAAVGAATLACSDAATSGVSDSPLQAAQWSLAKLATSDDLPIDTVLARSAPLRVVVRVDGQPASGVGVAWSISGDTTAPVSTTTGPDGIASFDFAFGSKAGVYLVRAALPQKPEVPPLSFSGTALPGHALEIRIVSGSGQSDSVTAQLRDQLVVRVTDIHDNATPGASVDWTVLSGAGSVSQAQTATLSPDGTAAVRYSLGRSAGANTIAATLHGADASVTFQANASAANPAKLSMVSGNNQSVEVNHALAADYVVKVTDAFDNPVSDVAIDWAITAGGGALSAAQIMSTTDGLGATRSTLGPTNTVQSVNATLHAWPKVPGVTFSSTATSGPPNQPPTTHGGSALVLVSGGGQTGVIGIPLAAPIVVKAIDSAGHALPNQLITFTVPSIWGSAAPPTATTDAQGLAQTVWTLGPNPSFGTITATAAFTTTVASANATATLPPLAFIGDPLYAPIPLSPSIGLGQFATAAVAPASGAPVAASVTVTLTHGPHTSMPATITIPAGGTYGRFQITAASAGTDTIVASAPGFAPATFVATVGLGTIIFFPSPVAAGTKVVRTICIAAPDGEETFDAASAFFSLSMTSNISIASFYGLDPNTPVTSVGFPIPGANCFFFYLKGISPGTATLTISSPLYKPLTVSILVTP